MNEDFHFIFFGGGPYFRVIFRKNKVDDGTCINCINWSNSWSII